MSRVRILNLPNDITETALKKHFLDSSVKGSSVPLEITDCSIRRNLQGKVRMAFLGFRSTGAAAKVVKSFNETYLGSRKIVVETALGLKEAARVKEEHAKAKRPRETEEREGPPSDMLTKEPTSEGNDVGDPPHADDAKRQRREEFVAERTEKKPGWAGELLTSPQSAGEVVPAAPAEISLEEEEARRQTLEKMEDLDFLHSKAVKSAEPCTDQPHLGTEAVVCESTELSDEALARETCRVLITNIPYTATENDVKNFFSSSCGAVAEVHVPVTKDTKQSKGRAFIRFAEANAAVQCLHSDGEIFMGRVIRVRAAPLDPYGAGGEKRPQFQHEVGPQPAEAVDDPSRVTHVDYKATKRAERNAKDASGLAWNPLYMAADTAVEKVAQKLNTTASSIVSVQAPGAAVRAAVAEAFLTSEARRVLGDEGIDFDVVNGQNALHKNRSDTTILIKNIAAGTDMSALTKLFATYGPLTTIAAPSSAAFCIVAFAHAQDARTAFRRLAYKRVLGGPPLYLEWAPIGSIVDSEETAVQIPTEAPTDSGNSGSKTVYITNLPFGTTEETLREFIADAAPRFAKLPSLIAKVNLLQDVGRAYVTTADEGSFQYLLSKLQGKEMMGRTVRAEASRSTKQTREATASAVPAGCNPLKLVVKNLPFEATEDDLRKLFSAFTEIKAVRVPKKQNNFSSHRTNNHRGFGFVEFLSTQEASNALQTLANTHLYGRHLVLEYAKKDQDAM